MMILRWQYNWDVNNEIKIVDNITKQYYMRVALAHDEVYYFYFHFPALVLKNNKQ